MSKKILIVEDNKDLHEMFKLKFEKWWFEVFIAEDWFNALWIAVDNSPDLILLDIMMPNMDWFETLKTLREEAKVQSKIIIFSNIKNNAHIEKAKKLWADDYFVKSDYTPSQVYDKVVSILSNKTTSSWSNSWESSSSKVKLCCPNCEANLEVSIKLLDND